MIAEKQDDFSRLSEAYIEKGFFSGALLRIEGPRRRDRVGGQTPPLYEGAWGLALDAGEERLPMERASRFDIASVTKLFTTTALFRLASLGRVGMHDRVLDILGYADPRLRAGLGGLELAELLAHSSGIHYWYPFYTKGEEPFEAILAGVLAEHPRRPEVVYSDINFMILGKVVQALSGLDLRRAVESLVIKPLGLAETGYGPVKGEDLVASEFGNRIERGMVAELGLDFKGWRPEDRAIRGECDDGNGHYYFHGAAGHAGIFSNCRDLSVLGRLYLEEGRLEDEPFLDPALVAEAQRNQGEDRGLGFQLGENYPGGGFGHTGFTGTYLHVNPGAGLVIALHANRLHVKNPRRINDYWKEVSRLALKRFT